MRRQAAIVCFDVTDESTFNTMKDWVEELKTNARRAADPFFKNPRICFKTL